MGEWKNDVRSGKGKFTWPNQSYYEGGFLNDNFHGNGEMYWSTSKNKYVGNWMDGVQNGQGTMTYNDGSKYSGNWVNN